MLLVLHSGIRPHGIDPDKLTHGHTVRYRIRNPSHNSNELHPKHAVERCDISTFDIYCHHSVDTWLGFTYSYIY